MSEPIPARSVSGDVHAVRAEFGVAKAKVSRPPAARVALSAHDQEWRLRARCRGESPDLFFGPDHERGAMLRHRERSAKSVCETCPVMQRCRNYALGAGEPYGVWGATTPSERRRLLAAKTRHHG